MSATKPGDVPVAVLVVDDEAAIRDLLVAALGRAGHVVFPAPGGAEALEVLRAHPEITLALVDRRMPGMDGLETVRALRALKPDLRCCQMGAHIEDADVLRAAGASRILHKPFSLDALDEVVRQLQQEAD